ncbi:MAG: hypothetical protein RDU20_18855 [Desulfomonilaceae bacterium]|nr:hypothetical protein [Desulfomonilaceae bacterium]
MERRTPTALYVAVDPRSRTRPQGHYIVLNPVRAGIVKHPEDDPWTSFRFTAGRETASAFLSTDRVLAQFGKSRREARKSYREFIPAGREEESPWKRLVGRCLLGEEPFLERLLPYLKDKTALTEIPRVQRFAVRPTLDRLLPAVRSGLKRDRAIAEAHVHHGYSLHEIAAHVGLHYSTLSRMVRREREKSKSKT